MYMFAVCFGEARIHFDFLMQPTETASSSLSFRVYRVHWVCCAFATYTHTYIYCCDITGDLVAVRIELGRTQADINFRRPLHVRRRCGRIRERWINVRFSPIVCTKSRLRYLNNKNKRYMPLGTRNKDFMNTAVQSGVRNFDKKFIVGTATQLSTLAGFNL